MPKCEGMAAVMELSQVAMPFPFLATEEPPLHLPNYAFTGGSFEELPAFDFPEYMPLFDGSFPECSAALATGSQGPNPVLPAGGSRDPGMTSDGM